MKRKLSPEASAKQAAAQRKWHEENLERLYLAVPKGGRDEYKAIAERCGVSMNALILEFIKMRSGTMDRNLRRDIAEHYDGSFWEPMGTRVFNGDGTSWQLYFFDQNVEHDGGTLRCMIVDRWNFNDVDKDDVDSVDEIFSWAERM